MVSPFFHLKGFWANLIWRSARHPILKDNIASIHAQRDPWLSQMHDTIEPFFEGCTLDFPLAKLTVATKV
jgi:hypothetical protein